MKASRPDAKPLVFGSRGSKDPTGLIAWTHFSPLVFFLTQPARCGYRFEKFETAFKFSSGTGRMPRTSEYPLATVPGNDTGEPEPCRAQTSGSRPQNLCVKRNWPTLVWLHRLGDATTFSFGVTF